MLCSAAAPSTTSSESSCLVVAFIAAEAIFDHVTFIAPPEVLPGHEGINGVQDPTLTTAPGECKRGGRGRVTSKVVFGQNGRVPPPYLKDLGSRFDR